MTLPNFLVIGAMKCATTTLYHDLRQNRFISCAEKEAGCLLPDAKEEFSPIERDGAKAIGEICTSYSMLPNITGVPERVRRVCGSQMRIVYLVRNPILRTLSHHQHFYNWHGPGQMGPDINLEIRQHPELIHYSQYAMQIKPWIDTFGFSQIHLIQFEKYIADRLATLKDLCRFLDVEADFTELDQTGANRGADRRVAGKAMLKFYQTAIFQKWLRPLSRGPIRALIRRVFLHQARQVKIPATEATLDHIRVNVQSDSSELARIFELPHPCWNLEATIKELRTNCAPRPRATV